MIIPHTKPITEKRFRQLQTKRISKQYKEWRNAVLERDGHKCQWPGCNCTSNLEVHHIRRYSENNHLRHEKFNGITLCEVHHKKIFGQEHLYEIFFFQLVTKHVAKNKNKDNN